MSVAPITPEIYEIKTPVSMPRRNCTLRERWTTAILGGLGAGLSALVFVGIAYGEESMGEFLFVALLLGIASYIFFDDLVELANEALGVHVRESPGHRKPLVAFLIVGVTFVIASLHKLLDAGLENDRLQAASILFVSLLFVGSVTSAWVKGAHRDPPRAARKGALRGLLVGALFTPVVVIAVFAGTLPGADLPPEVRAHPIALLVGGLAGGAVLTVQWVLLGLIGGMAIDKRWTKCPTRGVMYVLLGAATLLSVIPFLFSSVISARWEPIWLELAFVLWGWSAALILKGRTCNRLLEVASGSNAAPIPIEPVHAHADGWRPALGFGMALVLLLILVRWWRGPSVHVESVRFFESTPASVPKEDRIYQKRFRQYETRFLNYELHLKRELNANSSGIPLEVVWHKEPDGEKHSSTDTLTNATDAPTNRLTGIDAGQWEAGKYTVDFYDKKTKVGSGQFEVVPIKPEIQSVTFFEGPNQLAGQQAAVPHFRQDQARYIYYNVHLRHPASDATPLQATWIRVNRPDHAQQTVIMRESEDVTAGMGKELAGSWNPGHYRVDFTLANKASTSAEFIVDPAPSPLWSFSQQSLQTTQPLLPVSRNRGRSCCDCAPQLTNLQCFAKCNAWLPRCSQ